MTQSNTPDNLDQRLTAYALGELSPDEIEEVQTLLDQDPNLRREVELIQQTAAFLKKELASEAPLSLTAEQRAQIHREAKSPADTPVIFSLRRWWFSTGMLAAACLILAVFLPVLSTLRQPEGEQFVIQDDKDHDIINDERRDKRSPYQPGESFSNAAGMSNGKPDKPLDQLGVADEAFTVGVDTASVEVETSAEPKEEIAQQATPSTSHARKPPAEPKPVNPDDSSRMYHIKRNSESEHSHQDQSSSAGNRPPRNAPGSGLGGGMGSGAGMGAGGGGSRAQRPKRPPRQVTGSDLSGGISPESEERYDYGRAGSREGYQPITDNAFRRVTSDPLQMPTFSLEVDTAAYSNVRRFIMSNQLPPRDAVRIEELLNYFTYDDAPPTSDSKEPIAIHTDVGPCPWQLDHQLLRIGVKARPIPADMRPPTNLVFLLDVSGSMNNPQKLPLVKQSIRMLLDHLMPDDRVAIVVYAGAAGLVLDSTSCHEKQAILNALEQLRAGGSTAGAAGIQLAYQVAADNFIPGGVNRVILCTDGDFNVGASSDAELVRIIEEKRETGVFLSILGYGQGNWQDAKMEQLSNAGNGNFAYIDTIDEAKKVLVEEMVGTLITVAKDVKVQVDFNPKHVAAYRLIGYENRVLAAQDFNDDKKDAGEMGAGHSVVALFQVVPMGVDIDLPEVEPSKYAVAEKDGSEEPVVEGESADKEASDEMLEVRLRYKLPEGTESKLRKFAVPLQESSLAYTSDDFRFAAAVATFGMVLRDSPYKGNANMTLALELARSSMVEDYATYLEDFIHYARIAQPELAAANARVLLDTAPEQVNLAALLAERNIPMRDFDHALHLAVRVAELETVAMNLGIRMEEDRRREPVTPAKPVTTDHRREFIELIQQTQQLIGVDPMHSTTR